MTKEFIQAIYEGLPKGQVKPFHGKPAADIAAFKYILEHYGDNENIQHRINTYKPTGYVEYDQQYIKVLKSFS